MKNKLFLFALLIAIPCFADGPWCLLVASSDVDSMMIRLDSLITHTQTTQHYAQIIHPAIPGYPYVLLTIDERAQSILTPEEWASRLATMPAEFLPPAPTAP